MSNIRKLLDTINEMATVSGSVATVATPIGSTQRRNPSVYSEEKSSGCHICQCDPCKCDETKDSDGTKAPDAPKAKEFGLWKNSILAGSEQKKKKAKSSVKEDKNITEWREESEWKKSDNKDPRGKVTHMSDVARRKTEKEPGITVTDKDGYKEFSGIDDFILKNMKPNTRKHPTQEKDVMEDHPDVMRHKGDKTVKVVKRGGKPVGEIGIDAGPGGNGDYYVKLYDGSYDAAGFATAEEALAELKYATKPTVSEDSERATRLKSAKAQGKSMGQAYSDLKDLPRTGEPSERAAKLKSARSQGKSVGQAYSSLDEQGVAEASEPHEYRVGQQAEFVGLGGKFPPFPVVITSIDGDYIEFRSASGKPIPGTNGETEWSADPGWKVLTPSRRYDPNSLVAATSRTESKEENQLDRPEIQDAIKRMAARHKDEKWSLEKSKELGKRLAAAGKKLKVNELDTGAGQRQLNLAEEERLKEHDVIISPKSIRKVARDVLPKVNPRKDHEVEMARSDLYQSAKNAKQIYDMIESLSEDQGLEGWVQEKIIKAADYLNTVREYLEGEHIRYMRALDEENKSK